MFSTVIILWVQYVAFAGNGCILCSTSYEVKISRKACLCFATCIILRCGNKSKRWHKFISWYLKLAGLSGQTSSKVCNIHFVCCSDNLCTLELAKPIAEELLLLETQGIEVYDALNNQNVIVVAPLICIVADNPMASEITNHLRGAASK